MGEANTSMHRLRSDGRGVFFSKKIGNTLLLSIKFCANYQKVCPTSLFSDISLVVEEIAAEIINFLPIIKRKI